MEQDAEHRQHEEAIVPVRPGLRSPGVTAASERRTATGPLLIGAAFAVLVVAAAIVFVALPRWVAEPEPATRAAASTSTVEPAEPAEPALSEEEIAALTDRADQLLAQLLTQQQSLEALSASSWGGVDWQRYEDLGRAGDDAYLAEAFQDAVDSYSEAVSVGESLLARSDEITARALDAGQRALEAGNARLAVEQFDLVLAIEEGHEEATAGRARAERLPEVLALVQKAESSRQQGRMEEAADSYRAALEIDSAWNAARRGLEDVERRIAAAEYDALMSAGMQALAEQRYSDAEREFQAALAMRPDSTEARDGIMQADHGMELDQIALAEARALAFERRELWQQAIQQYEEALAADDMLAFAKSGLERARARADLDVKLSNLIDNPNLLFRDDVLASARQLVDEAAAVASGEAEGSAAGGENPRLREQIARLNELIALASTPVRVELRSDELTEVTVYRVGPLGSFASRELELRPGNYTAVGSRDGFRDVRHTFTVLPGRELEPISVVCVEPI